MTDDQQDAVDCQFLLNKVTTTTTTTT